MERPTEEPVVRPLRVLVVDDNRDAADTLSALVRLWGHDCRAAYDGLAGLTAALAYRPDCVVLDLRMPRMDGYQLARRVRAAPEFAGVKLVALSAESGDGHAQLTEEAGFDYTLTKPADPVELRRILAMLEQIAKLAGRTEELARENVALAGETRDLIKEVKQDIKEVKEDVKQLKHEVREVRDAKTDPGQ
jgi:CheY-like chemotaxis protein